MGLFGKKKNAPGMGAEAAAGQAAPDAREEAGVAGAAGTDELVAVIAAAVGAYESEQYRRTLSIRKLDRAAGARPAWGVAGMQEAIDMRRM